MKREGKTRELTVGITLSLALVIFAALTMLLTREKRIFHAKHTFFTTVSNSLGLKPGSPVVMGGVQIGSVTTVSLPSDIRGAGIEVSMSVDRAFGDRIREGSIASFGYITLLSGEKFINISPGDPAKPRLADGSIIPPDTTYTLLETGQNVAENLAKVTNELRDVLVDINNGKGLIGRILKDQEPYFGKQMVDSAESALDRTNKLLERIDKGEGTLGRLLLDRQYADETLGSVKSSAARLDRILEMVETKKGALGELIQENGQGQQTIADLRAGAASLKTASARLESSTGVIGRLLNDPDYSEKVAKDLHTISSSLASIMEKIDKGEGSLGALINDPTVYHGLQDIVGGIQKSRTGKFLLRHYGKKGAKVSGKEKEPQAEPQQAAPPPPPPAAPVPPPEPSEPRPEASGPRSEPSAPRPDASAPREPSGPRPETFGPRQAPDG